MLHKLNTIDMKHVVQSNLFAGASNGLPYIGVRFNEVQSISTTQSDPLLPPILHIKGPHGTPHAFRVVTSKPPRGEPKAHSGLSLRVLFRQDTGSLHPRHHTGDIQHGFLSHDQVDHEEEK